MAKREQMYRLMHISNFLKLKPKGATYAEVEKHLEEKYYQEGFEGEMAFSEKTFKRDRDLLFELFGIEIGFKRATMTYQFLEDGLSDSSQTIFDNLLLVNAYRKTADQSNIMLFEKRQASGLHNMEGIIYAIKNQKLISLNYTKFWEGIPRKRVLEPYAVKEFKNRWYLLANDSEAEKFQIKTYGFDRITNLDIHNKTFKKEEMDVNKMFENSFGIVSSDGKKPKKIVLSFYNWQGKFIKSLPLHHSQRILIDNEQEYRIELTLVPEYDFYQELLSHAEKLTVIEPDDVRKEYLEFLKIAIKKNKIKTA